MRIIEVMIALYKYIDHKCGQKKPSHCANADRQECDVCSFLPQAKHFLASDKQVKRIIPIRLVLSLKQSHVCALVMAEIASFSL